MPTERNLRLDGTEATEDVLFAPLCPSASRPWRVLTGPVSFPESTPAFAGFQLGAAPGLCEAPFSGVSFLQSGRASADVRVVGDACANRIGGEQSKAIGHPMKGACLAASKDA